MVSGWALKSAKVLDFIQSSQPLVTLDSEAERRLAGMITAAESFGFALRGALATVVAEGEAREALRETFYIRTQSQFERRLDELVRGANPGEVAAHWLADMRAVALDLFDAAALQGLDQRNIIEAQKIVAARGALLAAFNGYTKQGRDAFQALELAPRDKKVEEPA